MNRRLLEHVLSILLVITLAGCASAPFVDGTVMELGTRATQIGLERALQGAPNTHMITDGKLVFALWPVDSMWGGVCINCSVRDPLGQWRYLTGGRGMAMTYKTASEIVHYLVEEHGWQTLPAGALAKGEVLAAYAARVGVTLTGFLVLPIGVIEDQFERPEG
jgi:hypothetical protein